MINYSAYQNKMNPFTIKVIRTPGCRVLMRNGETIKVGHFIPVDPTLEMEHLYSVGSDGMCDFRYAFNLDGTSHKNYEYDMVEIVQ